MASAPECVRGANPLCWPGRGSTGVALACARSGITALPSTTPAKLTHPAPRPAPTARSYHAAVSQGIEPRSNQCYSEPHVRQFGYDFVRALGLPPRRAAACGESPTPVLFVRRVHYMAHPRHNGQIVRRLDNEDAIVAALEAGAAAGGVRLLNGLFSSMRLMEQVQAAQDACLIVGAHGAGLSHVLFAPDGVRVLELQPPMFARPHFIAYTAWAGGTHSAWHLTSSWPNEAQVVARVLAEAARAAGRAGDEPAAAAPGGGGVAAAWDGVARGPRGRVIVGAPPRA